MPLPAACDFDAARHPLIGTGPHPHGLAGASLFRCLVGNNDVDDTDGQQQERRDGVMLEDALTEQHQGESRSSDSDDASLGGTGGGKSGAEPDIVANLADRAHRWREQSCTARAARAERSTGAWAGDGAGGATSGWLGMDAAGLGDRAVLSADPLVLIRAALTKMGGSCSLGVGVGMLAAAVVAGCCVGTRAVAVQWKARRQRHITESQAGNSQCPLRKFGQHSIENNSAWFSGHMAVMFRCRGITHGRWVCGAFCCSAAAAVGCAGWRVAAARAAALDGLSGLHCTVAEALEAGVAGTNDWLGLLPLIRLASQVDVGPLQATAEVGLAAAASLQHPLDSLLSAADALSNSTACGSAGQVGADLATTARGSLAAALLQLHAAAVCPLSRPRLAALEGSINMINAGLAPLLATGPPVAAAAMEVMDGPWAAAATALSLGLGLPTALAVLLVCLLVAAAGLQRSARALRSEARVATAVGQCTWSVSVRVATVATGLAAGLWSPVESAGPAACTAVAALLDPTGGNLTGGGLLPAVAAHCLRSAPPVTAAAAASALGRVVMSKAGPAGSSGAARCLGPRGLGGLEPLLQDLRQVSAFP